ncbi:MAG: hypothetical protein ACXADY_21885 [Candidatus Hodarchaeales archaeon]|jgi:hypothetical protein
MLADKKNSKIFQKIGQNPQVIPEYLVRGSTPQDDPIFLSIIDNSGGCLFSKVFDQERNWNDQLLGFFLSAINKFCQNLFEGNIDRIIIGDYFLLFISQGSFFCCYVFKGISDFAHKKLNDFVEILKGSSIIWKALSSFSESGNLLSTIIEGTLDLLATEIFN